MNAKILKTVLMLFVSLVFSGCFSEKIIYVDRVVEKKVPVACQVPKPECNSNIPTDTGLIDEMYKCIKRWEDAAAYCSKSKDEKNNYE